MLHIGNEARVKSRGWAEAESVSVNAIVISMLEDFLKQIRKSRALRDKLRQECVPTGFCRQPAELSPKLVPARWSLLG